MPGALFGIQGYKIPQISKAGAEFMPPGVQFRNQGSNTANTGAPRGQGPGAGFFNYVSPGDGTCQVSGK